MTAAETYAARRTDIADLIGVLNVELNRLDELAKANPDSWRSAATAYCVRSAIVAAIAAAGCADAYSVEALLAD